MNILVLLYITYATSIFRRQIVHLSKSENVLCMLSSTVKSGNWWQLQKQQH